MMSNEVSSDNFNTDAVIEKIQELDYESSQNSSKLNEIDEKLVNIQEQQTERNIEATQAEDDQTQTLQESLEVQEALLEEVRDQIIINNGLVGGQYFLFGIIVGILVLKIIWDRFKL